MQGRWLGIPPDEVRSEISAGKVARSHQMRSGLRSVQGRWLGIPPDEVRSEISAGKVARYPTR